MSDFEPKYLLMIGIGLILSLALYIINGIIVLNDTKKNKARAVAVFGVSAIAAVASAFGLNYLLHPVAYGLPFSKINGLAFHSFYCVAFFCLFAAIFLYCLKLDISKYFNAAIPSVILGVAVAKMGCAFAGCCGGIIIGNVQIPTVEIEYSVNFVLFFMFQFVIKTNRLQKYFLLYAPFRFAIEFFRAKTFSIILWNVLKPEQILAIILTITAVIIYKFPKKEGR